MATSMRHASPAAAIDYGDRARIGMIVPSGNVVAEPELRAMLPRGVGLCVTRLPLTGTSPAALHGMLGELERAAELLAHARVDLIAFNCTAVSTYSMALEAEIQSRIERTAGIPAALTSRAVLGGLEKLEIRRVALLTPYRHDVNERERFFLCESGIDVTSMAGLGLEHPGDMADVAPSALFDFAMKHRDDRAEGYFLSCTAIRSAPVIDALEAALKRPVITSNQAIAWHSLRLLAIADPAPSFGALFHQRALT